MKAKVSLAGCVSVLLALNLMSASPLATGTAPSRGDAPVLAMMRQIRRQDRRRRRRPDLRGRLAAALRRQPRPVGLHPPGHAARAHRRDPAQPAHLGRRRAVPARSALDHHRRRRVHRRQRQPHQPHLQLPGGRRLHPGGLGRARLAQPALRGHEPLLWQRGRLETPLRGHVQRLGQSHRHHVSGSCRRWCGLPGVGGLARPAWRRAHRLALHRRRSGHPGL